MKSDQDKPIDQPSVFDLDDPAPEHSISKQIRRLLIKHPVTDEDIATIKLMFPEMGPSWRPPWSMIVAWSMIKDACSEDNKGKISARNQLLRYMDGLPAQVHKHEGHILTTWADIMRAADEQERKEHELDELDDIEAQDDSD